jgi:FkbM family methyltransferase
VRTLRSLVAEHVPESVLAATLRRLYPLAEPELASLRSYAPRGGTQLDVGVWYGPWTRRLRARADRVVAIEANPALAARLRRTYPDVVVVDAAASDHEGSARLYLPSGGQALAGVASLDPTAAALTRLPGEARSEVVRRITIDGLDLHDVRLVKLDIEGHELAALRGAERTIRRDRPMLLVELESRYQDVAVVVSLLRDWGYRALVMPGRHWVPLAEFDLVGHQAQALAVAESTFLRRITPPRPRYVNLVRFDPA